MPCILCLDIGGTRPRMALVEIQGIDRYKLLVKEEIKGDSLIDAINKFLAECAKQRCWTTNTACASVAGPVLDNSCTRLTNSRFTQVIGKEIESRTACKNVLVINDFQAIGEAVAAIDTRTAENIIKIPGFRNGNANENPDFSPQPKAQGARGIIGPGTGLGVAYLNWEGNGYVVHASEGGHAGIDAGAGTAALLEFIRGKLEISKISAETLVSGQGIRHIAHFLLTKPKSLSAIVAAHPEFADDVKAFEDKKNIRFTNKEILETILSEITPEKNLDLRKDAAEVIAVSAQNSPHALITMRLFMGFLGSAAQDIALHGVTTGGLFLAGGILPKNTELLMKGDFMRAFYDSWKESSRQLVRQVPVYLINDYDISFSGCARAAHLKFYPAMR